VLKKSTNSPVIGTTGFEPETSCPWTNYMMETRNCQDGLIDYVTHNERVERWRRVEYNSTRVVPPIVLYDYPNTGVHAGKCGKQIDGCQV